MAGRQLEIIVKATDNASATFGKIGNAADAMGRKAKGGGEGGILGKLIEEGHATKSAFRQLKKLSELYLVVELGSKVVEGGAAVWKSFGDNLDEARDAEYEFEKSVKELPFGLGKIYAAATRLGYVLAGRDYEKEQKALEQKKKALEEYGKAEEDLAKKLITVRRGIADAQLDTPHKERAKVDEEYQDKLKELDELKKKIFAAGSAGKDITGDVKQLAALRTALDSEHVAKAAEADKKIQEDEQKHTQALETIYRDRAARLAAIDDKIAIDDLNRQHRATEAKRIQINQDFSKQAKEAEDRATKDSEEARKGGGSDIEITRGLQTELARIEAGRQAALSGVGKDTDESLKGSRRDAAERAARLDDPAAKRKAELIKLGHEQEEIEKNLTALVNDHALSATQRDEAFKQLMDSRKQQAQLIAKLDADTLKDDQTFILQKQAALGDKLADKELKRVQIQKEYNDERKRLQAIINGEATAEDKATAKKRLATLNQTEAKELRDLNAPENNRGITTIQQSRFLTGVAQTSEKASLDNMVKQLQEQNRQAKDTNSKLDDIKGALTGAGIVKLTPAGLK